MDNSPKKRLVFWLSDNSGLYVVSKFLSDIIPQPGQEWSIPKGENTHDDDSRGISLLVEKVKIIVYPGDLVDINVYCRSIPLDAAVDVAEMEGSE